MNMTKKTIISVTLAAGMVFAASAKKWTNFTGVGVTYPVNGTVHVNNFKSNNFDLNITNYVGINEMYMGVHENGFAVRAFEESTFCRMNNQAKDFDFFTMGNSIGVGAGYAPVRTEKFTLGLFGMMGLDLTYGSSNEKKEGNTKIKYEEMYLASSVGGNITAVFTPKKYFSILAGCSVDCMLPGVYSQDKIIKTSDEEKSEFYYGKTDVSWKVKPSVGACFKF